MGSIDSHQSVSRKIDLFIRNVLFGRKVNPATFLDQSFSQMEASASAVLIRISLRKIAGPSEWPQNNLTDTNIANAKALIEIIKSVKISLKNGVGHRNFSSALNKAQLTLDKTQSMINSARKICENLEMNNTLKTEYFGSELLNSKELLVNSAVRDLKKSFIKSLKIAEEERGDIAQVLAKLRKASNSDSVFSLFEQLSARAILRQGLMEKAFRERVSILGNI